MGDAITKKELGTSMPEINLEDEIKRLIVESLDLEDISPEDIDTNAPLFGGGLGLDSIDALELGVALKKKFNIGFSAENKENRKYFASVKALADYIRTHE
jgi:acyl carrier protein